jgi:hypothetical protein
MTVLYYQPAKHSTKLRLHNYTVHDTLDSIPKSYVTVKTTLQQAPRILRLTDTYFLVHFLSIPIDQDRIDKVITNIGNPSLGTQLFLLKNFTTKYQDGTIVKIKPNGCHRYRHQLPVKFSSLIFANFSFFRQKM